MYCCFPAIVYNMYGGSGGVASTYALKSVPHSYMAVESFGVVLKRLQVQRMERLSGLSKTQTARSDVRCGESEVPSRQRMGREEALAEKDVQRKESHRHAMAVQKGLVCISMRGRITTFSVTRDCKTAAVVGRVY